MFPGRNVSNPHVGQQTAAAQHERKVPLFASLYLRGIKGGKVDTTAVNTLATRQGGSEIT